MKIKYWIYLIIAIITLCIVGIFVFKKYNFNNDFSVGQKIDSLNGVFVYYNGGVDNVTGRNITVDGYNLGLKYQCVEFVKRYYYEYLKHKMPDTYGHAKDFFSATVSDGQKNTKRNLTQYTNPSATQPKINDLLIFDGTTFNKFGHVAIVSHVAENEIEIIQQNPGSYAKSRVILSTEYKNEKWEIKK